jgi:N-formylglutamate amidohydrolase
MTMKNVLSVCKPENPLPVIFDSPHSGKIYPPDFRYTCRFSDLEKCEDTYVDELFTRACDFGGTFLTALFPRSYIDTNRAIDDIDPQLLEDKPHTLDIAPTSRSDAGIGLIRRLVRPGIPVYNRALPAKEIQRRIDNYYIPYHDMLENLLENAHYNFGQVWHINCHSMPNSTATPRRPIGLMGTSAKPADFVIGDRDGTTCDPIFTRLLKKFLSDKGYAVTINDPFKGVELIQRTSDPARGRHAVQIEVNKSLYMNEETGEKNLNFIKVQSDITDLIAFICNHAQTMLTDMAAD